MQIVLLATLFGIGFNGLLSTSVPDGESSIGFNEHIRPVLSTHCFSCHGPDPASRKGGLRLDTQEGAMASDVVVSGNAAASELINRINSTDPAFMMPPPEQADRLSTEEKALLENWVNEGAEWEKHWSFIKPRKVDLPQPEGVSSWARNPIDYFVFARLRQLQLKPNYETDRYALARRAAFDITGLPPQPEVLESFIADTSYEAYEKYLDTLLESKHSGEHRARYWLDAARYGDTHGMHVDNYREIWPYRDWVTEAFNSNMPFDQFVLEQIAGDLLPHPTLQQRIATGFNRCNITTSEGGAIPEELDVRYMVDRVETTSTVFLGLTTGCAVCHDHKYDPISQREFYQLGAFFNNTTQPAMDGNQKDTPPVAVLPEEAFREEWEVLQGKRKGFRNFLKQHEDNVAEWWNDHPEHVEHPVTSDSLALWLPLSPEDETIALPESASWATDHPEGTRGIRFTEKSEFHVDFPRIRSDEPLSVSFWFRTPDQISGTTIFDQTATTKDSKTIGWRITTNSAGGVGFELHDGKGEVIRGNLPDNEALTPRTWQHVCVRYSGGQSNSSISILANARGAALRNGSESHVSAADLAEGPLKIGTQLATAALSDVRIFRRWVSDEETRLLAGDQQINKLLASNLTWDALDDIQQSLISSLLKETGNTLYVANSRNLSNTEKRRDFIYARSTTTLVMQERPTEPQAWVLIRGEYDQRGDQVKPGVPAILPEIPAGSPRDRMGLARWLVSPDNPLTARVMINRMWQSVFGVGIVKTSEDFGVMGERPSHPELLDWLAVEFVESGWNINHMIKLMLTSAAYRQNSVVTKDKLRRDPENRFLARGPRLRLDAELLRDQVLAVSGLLRRDIGGPSVKPYQPSGLWNVVAITGSNTRVFKRDSGDALYRRSMYTFWKRTSPPPSMAAFNAPTREQCTVRRERTNTPLQALVLMNDPQFVEAARNLAERTILHSRDDRQRMSWILQIALSRPSSENDVIELLDTLSEIRRVFEQEPESAQTLIAIGDTAADKALNAIELASWTIIANTIMNRDDFINK